MWQTRTLCTFVAATVPVEKAGDESPLLESARRIGLPADAAPADENTSASAADRSRPGDYERFLASFGNPTKWR